MKICEYCGSQNPDDAVVCASCGGNAFQFQCVNCAFSLKGQTVCPRCGVMVGQEQKKCPRCKAKYYTLACPVCGFSPNWTMASNRIEAPVAPKKRHTALWVLGWIFLFPVPLTILLIRAEKLPVWAKVILILLAWVVFLLLGASGT